MSGLPNNQDKGKRREAGPDITLEQARSAFLYDKHTGSVTRIKKRSRWQDGYCDCYPSIVGEGRSDKTRSTVLINGVRYTLTHLIWFLVTGHWPSKHEEVDHRNHCISDNSWDNLRITDRGGNMMNCRKRKRQSSSQYVGVRRRGARWQARVKSVDGSSPTVGTFDSEEAAARARDVAAVRLFGDGVYLNFPEDFRE